MLFTRLRQIVLVTVYALDLVPIDLVPIDLVPIDLVPIFMPSFYSMFKHQAMNFIVHARWFL